MLEQRKWMVRPYSGERAKLPQAAFDTCPADYQGDPNKWQYAWTTPACLATFDEALAYWGDNERDIAGLCYVIHPLGEEGETLRLMCFDFDHCFTEVTNLDDDGEPVITKVLDPEVARFVEELDSFTEVSLSGLGLHVFVFVLCEPFRNVVHYPIGGCKVDIFCSHQIAVTGEVFEGHDTLNTMSAEVFDRFPQRASVDKDADLPDFWNEANDGLRSDHKYLVPKMEEWGPCIDDQRGGREMFKAACYLARHGVTGWDAFNFMANIEQIPPFTDEELQHKVECAWFATHAEEEFGVDGLDVFDAFPLEQEAPDKELQRLYDKYGVRTTAQLQEVEEPTFLVENLFVDKETLIIGGREKSFKTGLAIDLAVSLASGTPFVDTFPIESTRKVVVFTAEIGEPAIKLWVNRICLQKGISPIVNDLLVSSRLPDFTIDKRGNPVDEGGRVELMRMFELGGFDTAVFDPLYFALLGTSLGDMNAVGGVLRNISTLCAEVGVWPILCHHARKDSLKEFQPMSLGDLSGSGVPAFARQWLLSAHAEEFENGRASLYVRAGGSTPGDRGLWRVGIDEGVEDEITDRRWQLTVSSEEEHDPHEDAREQVLEALRYFAGVPEAVGSVCLHTGLDANVAKEVLRDLVTEGVADLQQSKFLIKG